MATRAVLSLGGSQAFRLCLSVVSLAVLSRFVTPRDFGLVASVAPFVGLASVLQDMGMSQVFMQDPAMTRAKADAFFWVSVAWGAVVSAGLACAARPLSAFFGSPEIVDIVTAYAAMPLLGGFSLLQGAMLARRFAFGRVAVLEAVATGVGFAVSLGLAATLHDYRALVAGTLASTLAGLAMMWLASGWTPGMPRAWPDIAASLRAGMSLSASNILNYVTRNADNVIVGKCGGMVELGVYDRAYKAVMLPMQQATGPVGRVMLPVLTRMVDDPARYRTAFGEATTLMMFAVHPLALLAAIRPVELTGVLLGPEWGGVAPVLPFFGLCAFNQVFTGTVGWLLLSQRRNPVLMRLAAFSMVTSVASFAVGVRWGAVGVAACYAATDYVLRMPVFWIATCRSGPVGLRDVAGDAAPHVVAGLVCAVATAVAAGSLPGQGCTGLALLAMVGQAAYASTLAAFPVKRRVMARLAGLALGRLRPWRPSAPVAAPGIVNP